ncbi:MAG TPA: hypothetical protein VF060_20565 [Trebonia sp.]
MKPRQVDVYDARNGTVGSVPLADVAADLHRYELLTEAEAEAEL